MAKHFEAAVAQTNEWWTPPEIFNPAGEARPGLVMTFDLDPCSTGAGLCYVPAKQVYTKADNGLILPWFGQVFENPPFNKDEGAKRNGIIPWLVRFFDHEPGGILLVRAQTSCGWWNSHIEPNAELHSFVKGKTRFLRGDGSRGKQPTSGVALIAKGEIARAALLNSSLGSCHIVVDPGRGVQLPLDWRGRAA